MPGARAAFKIVRKNPNPGGQCVCSPNSRVTDCQPPYCVWTHSESMNVRAPHIVVGDGCMRRGVEKAHPGAFKVPEPVVVTEYAPLDVEAVLASVRASLPQPDAA